ncbi:type I polyketide synthase [Microbulbifer rhizosphaerae]|uniref:Acyl transferase domain-containing protein/NAD(P)-dependent dehydrogenase (Short-subunit alcohol dehydrogenase family)/acyl carrier protein n=1 Tax=Microbulbifer rhizosphaerae TaxID=1562603 RepID=A0A7W4Z961_9GAMM|nr:type I polyketide synthase [Microbulbifer rhizosphaerae]MBB3061498.1 acyl transferase domain-containing protein/NAD(P)-dependent dehydrogenase (short-subunit alcohol dehydrogenase family)/acyl carrier protein [Microbulbifer rhizosphaerae]
MIAIIGASCCLPGGIETVQDFWESLCAGNNMASDVPKSRWNSERFYHPDSSAPGKTYMSRGHFIERDLAQFDYDAFRISKREAEGLDPQQRLLLELTWQAMEESGFTLDALPSRKVGVYVGGFTMDHFLGQFSAENRPNIGVHTASGSTLTMLSNRISHTFDFQGPSLTIDTACSSSLVAYHYACEDLRKGLCDIAVVGGVNLMMRPEYPIGMAKGGFLAADGRSKSFDASGDGYGRGEGGVVLVLRREEDAKLDCNSIWALHAGSGVNQDGRTPGITLPSGEAQTALMEDVLQRHNIDADAVAYVEAHGTGTAAGDPIEAASISSVYGRRRQGNICYIGSAKSNVGHLEAGSGLVGVLKAALIAKTRTIPPIAGFNQPNPKIELDERRMALADQLRSIGDSFKQPMVAINSFGYGGTNAHVVLQHYSADAELEATSDSEQQSDQLILLLSAATRKALLERARQALRLLAQHPQRIDDVVKSFSRHASLSKERVCFIARDNIDLLAQLNDFLDEPEPHIEVCTRPRRKIGFVYTGMGPQWYGMGQQLYRENSLYREAALDFDERFKAIAGFSILQEMQKDEQSSRIGETEFAQPANLLIQVALTHTLRAYGIEPHAVTGHSVGDVTAAFVSGGLSLDDAIRVSLARSQLQGTLRNRGSMLAAAVDEPTALELIAQTGAENTSLAAENSPQSVTLAGPETELGAIAKVLQQRDLFHRMLTVEVPYHSPVMDEIHGALQERLADLDCRPLRRPCFSTVTGGAFQGPFDNSYWNRNVRQPVRFRKAIEAMVDAGCEYFLEVGPHPVLARSLQETVAQFEEADCTNGFVLRRGEDEITTLKQCVKHLYSQSNGFARTPLGRHRRLSLPAYPWDKKEVWSESPQTHADRCGEILSPMLERTGEEPGIYLTDLSLYHLDYLKSHVVDGSPVIPAAAVVEAALETARLQRTDGNTLRIADARFMRTLALDDRGEQLLIRHQHKQQQLTVLGAAERGAGAFKTEMAQMTLQHCNRDLGRADAPDCPVADDIPSLYTMFNDVGLHSDELFQTVLELRHNIPGDRFQSLVEVNSRLECDGYLFHPTLLDGIFQSTAAFISDTSSAYIPVSVQEILLQPPAVSPRRVGVNGSLRHRDSDTVSADLQVFCVDSRRVLMQINGLTVKRIKEVDDAQLLPAGNYQSLWQATDELVLSSASGNRILLLASEEQPLAELVALLTQDGARVDSRTLSLRDLSPAWHVGDTPMELDGRAALAEELSLRDYDSVVLWADLQERNPAAAAEAVCALAQAMRRDSGSPPRLSAIVENAAAVTGGEILSPQSGAILGALRVIWSEMEDVQVRLIDLDDMANTDPYLLLGELLNGNWCDEVAFRQGQRFQSLVHNQPAPLFSSSIQLAPGEPYRWLPTGHNWLKEALPLQRDRLIDGIVVELSAGGDRSEFARTAATVPSLIVGRQEVASELGILEKRCVTVAPLGEGNVAPIPAAGAPWLPVDDENLSAGQVMQAAFAAWGQVIVQRQQLVAGDRVLTDTSPLGCAIADAARAAEAEVSTVDQPQQSSGGFALIAAPLGDWCRHHDFSCLLPGGKLVNTDLRRADHLPAGVGLAVEELCRYRADFESTLQRLLGEGGRPPVFKALRLGGMEKLASADLQHQPVLDWRIPEEGAAATAPSRYDWDSSHWMLVTGGLGGIGEKFIQWLAEQSVRKIVIAGRSAESKVTAHPSWQKLALDGVELAYIRGDIADPGFVEQLEDFQRDRGAITTVAHLAGIIDDSPLSEMRSDAFRSVIRVKAAGINNILRALPVKQLHTVINFSSIALVTGNSRQANYCAANQYLENIGRNLRRQGVNSLVVHVGAIRDVGMIQRDRRLRQHINNTGLSLISSASLFVGINHALLRGDSVVTAAGEPNWEQWSQLEVGAARAPRFREVLADVGSGGTDIYQNLRQDLAGTDPGVRQTIVGELIRDAFAPVLRLPAEEIPLHSEFSDLGIDSLMAAELQGLLKKILGMDVSILNLIGENQSVRKLADTELNKMGLEA